MTCHGGKLGGGGGQTSGGWSKQIQVTSDPKIQGICDKCKLSAEERLSVKFDKFWCLAYRQQVVAGMNYLMKLTTTTGYMHIKVYVNLKNEVTLMGIQTNKTLKEPIELF